MKKNKQKAKIKEKSEKLQKKMARRNSKSFWAVLKKPIFVIAPMANVTDCVFRAMFAKYGGPDVMWTEFVSADGLNSSGKDHLMNALKFSKKERPIVAQLFTSKTESMEKAAVLIKKLGFDGLDINMGCPDRSVLKQRSGAAMIQDPKNAVAVLNAARKGWGGGENARMAISVKTRIGYSELDFNWILSLLKQNLPVLTIHLRTRKELSEVPAHWEIMPKIVKLRDKVSPSTLIIGNGDVSSIDEAIRLVEKTGCDGIMIGRGVFGKPWFFAKAHSSLKERAKFEASFTPSKRLKVLIEHAKLYEKTFKQKNFDIMKKHIKAYVSGWEGAKDLRSHLMEAKNAKDLEKLTKESKV